MRALQGILVVALAASACSQARPQQGNLARPVSWEEDIAPLFAAQCNSCHSGAAAAAGYRTTSYLEALGSQSAPVAVAGEGDSKSLLLRTINPAGADAVHAPVAGAYDQTRAWVVDGRLSFFRSSVHEGGILNPQDPQFHSNLVRVRNWNFATCQKCHGADFTGGTAGVSCQQCHALQVGADGTPTCSSCHGSAQSPAPPHDLSGNTSSSSRGVGAHKAHLFGRTLISAPIACSVCHKVPADVSSPGHPDHSRPATVTFSGLALADGAAPVWNGASCSNTYCHGGGAKLGGDTAASLRAPVWTAATAQAFCGSCHGAPPANAQHAGITFPDCARCHSTTVGPTGLILVSGPPDARTSTHVNGVIDVTP
jgi:predicted CxxxxCH...CXXCH cytochrome family protein